VERIKNELIPVADDLLCFGGPFNLYPLVGDGELALLEGGLSVIYPPALPPSSSSTPIPITSWAWRFTGIATRG